MASWTPASRPALPSRLPARTGCNEIKHDGYRLIVRRNGAIETGYCDGRWAPVRLFTRRGYDWTDRYPAISAAAAKLRAKSMAGGRRRSQTIRSPRPRGG
jgi:bifunctional non-homologous end joining protein LigD